MADEDRMTVQNMPRIGVILCECGGLIGDHITLEELEKKAAGLPGVVYARIMKPYPCSKDGQERLRRAVQEFDLDRVLIAGCSPRLVEKLFRKAVQETSMDPGYLMVANILELSTIPQNGDPQQAFQKALSIIEMGVARPEHHAGISATSW
jgi:heterodisulfide reductase subunit A